MSRRDLMPRSVGPTSSSPRSTTPAEISPPSRATYISRVYYIYDVPTGSVRAAHAHRKLHQLYIALAGSFELHLDDGHRQETLFLNRPDVGLHVRPGVWRLINNFSGAALCFVLAAEPYDEADYIRSYDEFRRYVAGNAASPSSPQ
jgi:hypothetical protein